MTLNVFLWTQSHQRITTCDSYSLNFLLWILGRLVEHSTAEVVCSSTVSSLSDSASPSVTIWFVSFNSGWSSSPTVGLTSSSEVSEAQSKDQILARIKCFLHLLITLKDIFSHTCSDLWDSCHTALLLWHHLQVWTHLQVVGLFPPSNVSVSSPPFLSKWPDDQEEMSC